MKKEFSSKDWLAGSALLYVSYILLCGATIYAVLTDSKYYVFGLFLLLPAFYFHLKQDYDIIKVLNEKKHVKEKEKETAKVK